MKIDRVPGPPRGRMAAIPVERGRQIVKTTAANTKVGRSEAGRRPPGAPLKLLLVAACAALAGCGNYEFRKAEQPTASWTLKCSSRTLPSRGRASRANLVVPAREVELHQLLQERALAGSRKAKARPRDRGAGNHARGRRLPAGVRPAGDPRVRPLFTYATSRSSHFDTKGEGFEVRESRSVLWRLWAESRLLVKTLYGNRVEYRQELLFGLLPLPARVTYHRLPLFP